MANFSPFLGLRYDPVRVGDLSNVIAPPYDVISRTACDVLSKRHPNNVIRLILGDPSTFSPAELANPSRYTQAAETLAEWRKNDILIQDKEPSFYILEEAFQWKGMELRRRGLIGTVELESFGKGNILPHERTLAGPIEDRLKLLTATQTHLSPIYMVCEDPSKALASLLDRTTSFPPLASFRNLDEGTQYRFWRISSPLVISQIRQQLAKYPFLIADGHHRYTTALHFSEKEGGRLPESRQMLTYLAVVPDPGVVLGAIHRVFETSLSSDDLRKQLETRFSLVEQTLDASAFENSPALMAWVDANRSKMTFLTPRSKESSDIPTVLLNEEIVRPIFNLDIQLPEDQKKIHFCKTTEQVVSLSSEKNRAGFWLKPLRVEQVIHVAKGGETLPQKSTFFYPKVMTGLVFHTLT